MPVGSVPNDRHSFVYWMCLLLGCGTLLSFNLLITCADYLHDMLPNYPDIMFYVVPASACTQLIFLVLMILRGHNFSFTLRIVPSFILSSIALGILPICIHQLPQSAGFWIVIFVSAFIGITTAVLQSSIVGFCNFLPLSYIQLSFGAQATSGIVSCLIRIITKLCDIYGGITAGESGIVYFVTGAIFDIICGIAFIFVIRSIFTQYCLVGDTGKAHYISLIDGINNTDVSFGPASVSSAEIYAAAPSKPVVSYRTVFMKIWTVALSAFLVYFITLLAYPGLLVGIHSQYPYLEKDAWMPVILVVCSLTDTHNILRTIHSFIAPTHQREYRFSMESVFVADHYISNIYHSVSWILEE
eukprot:193350_1